jgi:hypothetical protein
MTKPSPESVNDRSPGYDSPGPASSLSPRKDHVTVSESNPGEDVPVLAEPGDFLTDDQIKKTGRATLFDPKHEIYGAIYNENGSVTLQLGPNRVNITFDSGEFACIYTRAITRTVTHTCTHTTHTQLGSNRVNIMFDSGEFVCIHTRAITHTVTHTCTHTTHTQLSSNRVNITIDSG